MDEPSRFCSDHSKLVGDVGEIKGTVRAIDKRMDAVDGKIDRGFGSVYKKIDKLKERAKLDEEITQEIPLILKKRSSYNPFADGDGNTSMKKIMWFLMGAGFALYILISQWSGFMASIGVGAKEEKQPTVNVDIHVMKKAVEEAVREVVKENGAEIEMEAEKQSYAAPPDNK